MTVVIAKYDAPEVPHPLLDEAGARRQARALARVNVQPINSLPDELLARCLVVLPPKERLSSAALVNKRFHRASVAATRACNTVANSGSELARLRSLAAYLAKNAQHVRDLALGCRIATDDPGYNAGAELVAACIAACAAAAARGPGPYSLQRLSVHLTASPRWTVLLASLVNLQKLELCTRRQLRLPAGMRGLRALADVRLRGCQIVFDGPSLPSGITNLKFSDFACAHLPAQIVSLPALAKLELGVMPLAAEALAPLAGMPTLRRLSLVRPLEGVPVSLVQLTAVQEISYAPEKEDVEDLTAESDALCVALPRALTTLSPDYIALPSHLLPALAMLERLETLRISGGPPGDRDTAGLPLPAGSWLSSLRTLEAPWRVVGPSIGVLRSSAPRLETLACTGWLAEGSRIPRELLHSFFDLLSTHPPLCYFSIAGLYHDSFQIDHHSELIRLCTRLLRQRPTIRFYPAPAKSL